MMKKNDGSGTQNMCKKEKQNNLPIYMYQFGDDTFSNLNNSIYLSDEYFALIK